MEFLILDLVVREQVLIHLGHRTKQQREEEEERHSAKAGMEN